MAVQSETLWQCQGCAMHDYHEVCRTRFGHCIINKYDQVVSRSLKQDGVWCPHEIELLRQLIPARGTVVEAGANFGSHTLAFANFVGPEGRVYAFEPQRIVYQALCGTVALNSLGNVMAFNAAAGEAAGWIEVPQPDYAAADNFGALSLQKPHSSSTTASERVPIITIDQLALPACHVIKADVEGMEAAVVRGAVATIARHRPFFYLENHDDSLRPPLIALCRSLGYELYWHGTQFDPNMLCIPAERGMQVQGLERVASA